MNEILFFKPIVKECVWGREYWLISAHENGDTEVLNGDCKGRRLSWLFANKRELFGNLDYDRFPLLVKIIDAQDDLSVQVHPDDEYAHRNENGALGKTECWNILECDDKATIVIGHNAATIDEAKEMIANNRWSDFLREIPIKRNDFFQITPGTVHAIKSNTKLIEIQQNSDITYRMYDYNRVYNGKQRELHLSKSLDVINIPFDEEASHVSCEDDSVITCDFYCVDKYEIDGVKEFDMDKSFHIISVIAGSYGR